MQNRISIKDGFEAVCNCYILKNGNFEKYNGHLIQLLNSIKEDMNVYILGVPFRYRYFENGSYLEDLINHSIVKI